MMSSEEEEEERSDEECGRKCIIIGGDILEEIISHVPLVDLVSANRVSSSWRSAISNSLLRVNRVKPWLMIHSHSTRSPNSAVTTLAYDPRSNLWMEFQHQPKPKPQPHQHHHYFSVLRSSHSSLLYMLSATKFAFSLDPLHINWQQIPTPIPWPWRPDPVVAAVGNHIVVLAGSGACSGIIPDDNINHPPVQIYDTTTRTWESCQSMPTEIMESASSTWLSVAADETKNKMYVSVKSSGATYSFDPRTKTWCGPYDVRGDVESVFYSVIGYGGNNNNNGNIGMIGVGLRGEAEDVRSVVMWEVEVEGEKWEMPFELMEKLKGSENSTGYMPSVTLNVMGDFVFVHNPLQPREIIVCQRPCPCRWGSITATALDDDGYRFRNLVLSCSNVTLPHLEQAFTLGTQHFSLKT